MMPITALLISDSTINATAISELLGRSGEVIISVVASESDVFRVARSSEYSVALIDLPVPIGPLVARRILGQDPNARIVVYGVRDDEADVIAWARAGTIACVAKRDSLDDLVAAIQSADAGIAHCSPSIARALFIAASRFSLANSPISADLTSREEEILRLLGFGWSNKQIATALTIELPTVKNHLHNLFRKLGVHTRRDAERYLMLNADEAAAVGSIPAEFRADVADRS